MRTTTILFALLLCLIPVSMSSQSSQRVIFFGDSITELGVKPDGYIVKIKERLEKDGKSNQYELLGAGVSGNKIYDLFLRMEDDVLRKNPAIVVVYIGVNDVWHKSLIGTGTDADKFEKFYSAILKKLQEKNIKAILCTPAVIGEKNDCSNQQDGDLNKYSQIIRTLAARYNSPLCDLRKAFTEYSVKNNPTNKDSGILTTDKVHLNEKGNQLVADMLLPLLVGKN
jgi:lysophospholipase L1-like esterase